MVSKVVAYFWRATLLRCPVCGISPMFPKLTSVRRLSDYFAPLDGCPRCGYAYEREPGYFLMSIWAINYGAGSALGIVIYLILLLNFKLSLAAELAWVLIPVCIFNVVFARHSKSYFIAFDHLCDPHRREGGDDGGNRPTDPPKVPTPTPDRAPTPEPEETAGVR